MLQHYLHEKFETWFKLRSPTTTLARLNIRNVYIFLSKEGVMFVLLLLITFVAGTNYANNLVLGFCFLLSSLFIISIHYTFAHLAGLQVKLIEVGNATQGDYVQVRLQVSSQAKQPHRQIYLSFGSKINQLNKPLQGTAQNDNLFSDNLLITQVQEPKIISLYLKAHERGRFDLPKLTVSTVYPLGILRAWSYVFLQGHGWIFPRALAYDSKTTQFAMSQKEETASIQIRSGQEDFEQLDSYIAGESLARISWSHFARGQGLLSKRFVDNVGQEQVLDYYQMPASTHEEKLSQLRFGVDKLSHEQIAFRMILPNDDGVLGQGETFKQASLLRLAQTP